MRIKACVSGAPQPRPLPRQRQIASHGIALESPAGATHIFPDALSPTHTRIALLSGAPVDPPWVITTGAWRPQRSTCQRHYSSPPVTHSLVAWPPFPSRASIRIVFLFVCTYFPPRFDLVGITPIHSQHPPSPPPTSCRVYVTWHGINSTTLLSYFVFVRYIVYTLKIDNFSTTSRRAPAATYCTGRNYLLHQNAPPGHYSKNVPTIWPVIIAQTRLLSGGGDDFDPRVGPYCIHIHISSPRLPALALDHQENVSLSSMIKSMEVARYSSGIMRTPLLLSSNTPYTRLSIYQSRGDFVIPWLSCMTPNEVLKARSEEATHA